MEDTAPERSTVEKVRRGIVQFESMKAPITALPSKAAILDQAVETWSLNVNEGKLRLKILATKALFV